MLKKTIKYTDYNGEEVVEDFYFNLNKAELIDLEMSADGGEGLAEMLKRIVAEKNTGKIMRTFRSIICLSVGVRSEDGKRFIKTEEIVDEFMQTGAYSELLVELLQNPQAAVDFVNGIVPKDLSGKNAKPTTETNLPVPATVRPKRIDEYTDAELAEMSSEELQRLMATAKGGNIPRNVLLAAIKRN